MYDRPQVHFVKAYSPEECEILVNDWINALPFACTILNIIVLPMMLGGTLTFLAIVTYTAQPAYINSEG
jgi:hypothetical protein